VNHSLSAADVEIQRSEWRKRPSPGAPFAPAGTGRYAHDNTSLIELLAARHPVTRRLAGESSFRIVARRFINSDPPTAPVPDSFGDNFPRYIRSMGNAACIEYVADVAELETLRWKARYAPNVQPIAASGLSSLRTERLKGLRVTLHPSVCLVQSRFPIVTTWENNQPNEDGDGLIERWAGEAALVARPLLEVEVRRLPFGGYAFLRAISEGKTVAMAVRIATEIAPTFDIVSNLKLIEDALLAVDIREAAGVPKNEHEGREAA
jgi:hypothetical protein